MKIAPKLALEIIDLIDRLLHFFHRASTSVVKTAVAVWCDLVANTVPLDVARELNYRRYQRFSSRYSRMRDPFGWEQRIFDSLFPKPPARVLIGGAGAGREAELLLRKGFDVVCFDPVNSMVQGMRSRFNSIEATAGKVLSVQCCSYEDLLPDGAEVHPEHTEWLLRHAPFDACILGWGSLSLILAEKDRIEVTRLFRSLCPQGPILVSWIRARPEGLVRRWMRNCIAQAAGRNNRMRFAWGAGYYEAMSRPQIVDLAKQCAERIESFSEQGGYALFGGVSESRIERHTVGERDESSAAAS